MELTSQMEMERFQTIWIQMRNAEKQTLDESCKTGQTSGTKMTFYSLYTYLFRLVCLAELGIRSLESGSFLNELIFKR
ncbi:hypothetical protein Hanom_Chr01g00065661 [Helianthus anomalus]